MYVESVESVWACASTVLDPYTTTIPCVFDREGAAHASTLVTLEEMSYTRSGYTKNPQKHSILLILLAHHKSLIPMLDTTALLPTVVINNSYYC